MIDVNTLIQISHLYYWEKFDQVEEAILSVLSFHDKRTYLEWVFEWHALYNEYMTDIRGLRSATKLGAPPYKGKSGREAYRVKLYLRRQVRALNLIRRSSKVLASEQYRIHFDGKNLILDK